MSKRISSIKEKALEEWYPMNCHTPARDSFLDGFEAGWNAAIKFLEQQLDAEETDEQ